MPPTVYILYENDSWNTPFFEEFRRRGMQYVLWDLKTAKIDMGAPPPVAEGAVVFNRFSPSSYWRSNPQSLYVATELLRWLDHYGVPVVNGEESLRLESSKALQHLACLGCGIPVPRTRLCTQDTLGDTLRGWPEGQEHLIKPICGGSGRYHPVADKVRSPDHLLLVQYVEARKAL